MFKPQRIRDPLHNIIPFTANEFEDQMWQVTQTRPFQRLRRVKQLGFSDYVYPGATHSRFAHSVGVFHTARALMKIIEGHLRQENSWAEAQSFQALAAALVHDVGHGPFSHAFEAVGKRLNLKMANHEIVSDLLIRDSEISDVLKKRGSGFADDVADIVKGDGAATLYSAVVSSQFDADRLDYMRRDRLMIGSGHGAIDFDWLVSNIEIGTVKIGVDDEEVGEAKTFVLNPKAIYAAEAYVLGLFHLYPAVYFHKTTRGVEKIFTELLCRIFELVLDESIEKTGLPPNHPLCKFALDADSIESVLNLDDTVIWGALNLFAEAEDGMISKLALRLRDRKLFQVHDIRAELSRRLNAKDSGEARMTIDHAEEQIFNKVDQWLSEKGRTVDRILKDKAARSPYKALDKSKGPINQISIRSYDGKLVDLGEHSAVVSEIEPFKLGRLYARKEDEEANKFIKSIIEGETLK